MIVCDPNVHVLCPCLGEDEEDDPHSCECKSAPGLALVCDRCGAKMIVIDADSGQRLAS